ncbi:hypothetical protein [Microbacterium sp. CSI-V]|uniref:hypothetical protein n=1 Tax=Microbacterium sp. CSI-V TaxID=1933777 RepID=UPI0011156364|nr:hypothetical protein [Microbacterium sp. CSI-V]
MYLGPEFYLPSGTAARWRALQRLGLEKYGVWLVPTPGWNGYRPLSIQYQYRAELGIWAAVPRTSSHGLTFNGRDMAAIDVNNWRALAPWSESLAWARFVALCRIVGFIVDFVSPQELWHIGDPDPYTIPAFAVVTINPGTTRMPEPEEDDMPTIISSPIGQSLSIGGVVVPFPTPDDVKSTKSTTGAPVQIMETTSVMHSSIIAAAARQDAAAAQLPIVVYAQGGNGTVYIYEAGRIDYLTEETVLHDLLARGAQSVTWPQGEIDSLRKQQQGA